jgi:hypothetical protein
MSAETEFCAIKLSEAASVLSIEISPGKVKKGGNSKGKGTTLGIFTKHTGRGDEMIALQMPRALTFGVRPMMNNNGSSVPTYQLTLKYRMDQTEDMVEPLRSIYDKIKQHIVNDKFDVILPKTTATMVKKLNAKHNWFPKDLFDVESAMRDPKATALFREAAKEKIDEIFVFGGSEDTFDEDSGKSKMVSFSPEKASKDGGTHAKAWMVNLKAPVSMDKQGKVIYHPSSDTAVAPAPVFTFSACEGPEYDLSRSEDIENSEMLRLMGPEKGQPFSREGVAVISFRYMHVRDDESQVSVNMTLEHFHAYQREAITNKRKFVVRDDKDTPQVGELPPKTAGEIHSDDDDISGDENERE